MEWCKKYLQILYSIDLKRHLEPGGYALMQQSPQWKYSSEATIIIGKPQQY